MRLVSLSLLTAVALALPLAACNRGDDRQQQQDSSMHPAAPGAGPKPGQPDPTGATVPRAGMGYDPSKGSAMNPGTNPRSQVGSAGAGRSAGPNPSPTGEGKPGVRGPGGAGNDGSAPGTTAPH